MATTPVTLKVDGFKDREVASVSYTFNQSIDKENQPAGIPRGGLITIKVKAQNDGNPELPRWMINKSMSKNGEIIFMISADADKKMKSIKFEKAYCIDFKEQWDDSTTNKDLVHWEQIIISCQKIDIEGVKYESEWK